MTRWNATRTAAALVLTTVAASGCAGINNKERGAVIGAGPGRSSEPHPDRWAG